VQVISYVAPADPAGWRAHTTRNIPEGVRSECNETVSNKFAEKNSANFELEMCFLKMFKESTASLSKSHRLIKIMRQFVSI